MLVRYTDKFLEYGLHIQLASSVLVVVSMSKLSSLAWGIVARKYVLADASCRKTMFRSAVADVAGTISINLVECQTWSRSVCTPVMLFSTSTIVPKVTFSAAEVQNRWQQQCVLCTFNGDSSRLLWHCRNFVKSFSPVAAMPAIPLLLYLQETVVGESVCLQFRSQRLCQWTHTPAFNSPLCSLYGSFRALPCPAISQSGGACAHLCPMILVPLLPAQHSVASPTQCCLQTRHIKHDEQSTKIGQLTDRKATKN